MGKGVLSHEKAKETGRRRPDAARERVAQDVRMSVTRYGDIGLQAGGRTVGRRLRPHCSAYERDLPVA